MKLLPPNTKLTDQNFTKILDKQSKEEYQVFKIDPLTCHSSLLEHIALEHNIDISNLNEKEARAYLSFFLINQDKVGTVSSTENAIDYFLGQGKIVEWFEDTNNLRRGQFLVYTNNSNVKLFLRNIKFFKNVRSQLVSITNGKCAYRFKLGRNKLDSSTLDSSEGVTVEGVRVCFKAKQTVKTEFKPSKETFIDSMKNKEVEVLTFIDFGVEKADIKTTVVGTTQDIKLKSSANAITESKSIKTTVVGTTQDIKLKGDSSE